MIDSNAKLRSIQMPFCTQVNTEKTARDLQPKKVKFLHFFTLIYCVDLMIVMIK